MAGTGAPKGMIFLDPRNKIITEFLEKKFEDPATKEVSDQAFSEFDDVTCLLQTEGNVVFLSACVRCWDYLLPQGAPEVLSAYYGPLLTEPAPGYNVTLRIDLSSPPAGMDVATVIERAAKIRTAVLGAPLRTAFAALATSSTKPGPCAIPYRGSDVLYVIPRDDHIAVVFLLHFEDHTERAIARIIAEELAGAKNASAPLVSFSIKDPPSELTGPGAPPVARSEPLIGFITFSVQPPHIATAEKMERVVTLLTGFRTYMSYHIKATKANLHARMRSRVDKMLQVLSRAIPENPFASKDKKLMNGKTFVRKA